MPFGSFLLNPFPPSPSPPVTEDDMLIFSGRVQPSHDGALDWFLGNTGNAIGPLGAPVTTIDPLTIPTPAARTFSKISAVIPNHSGNDSGVAITVTLVKYAAGSPLGVPTDTALTVNIPIGAAGQTIFNTLASVSFVAGDAFDIKVHVPIPVADDSGFPVTVVLT